MEASTNRQFGARALAAGAVGIAAVLLGTSVAWSAPIEMLTNGGAEEPLVSGELPGWTEAVGTKWTTAATTPDPQEGLKYFFCGNDATAELQQDVDAGDYAFAIDQGVQSFAFSGWVRSYDQAPTDMARLVVEYRSIAGQVLDSFDSGEIGSTDAWVLVEDTRVAPAGTRTIRVSLHARRQKGSNNDAYFDSLSLLALDPPDTVPPAGPGAVTDLRAEGTGAPGEVRLLWTTPQGELPAANHVRWATQPIGLGDTWQPATREGYDAGGHVGTRAAGKALGLADSIPGRPDDPDRLTSFRVDDVSGAGLVVSDGTHLYVRRWGNEDGTAWFRRYGTGLHGTEAGAFYGTVGPELGFIPSAALHDGFIYVPSMTDPYSLRRIAVATGAIEDVTVPEGLLHSETGEVAAGEHLITADGQFGYSVSYGLDNAIFSGWALRTYTIEPDGTWLQVDDVFVPTTTYNTDGVWVDGTHLFVLEWKNGSAGARLRRLGLVDLALEEEWRLSQCRSCQPYDAPIAGAWDPINEVYWFGDQDRPRIAAYPGPKRVDSGTWTSAAHDFGTTVSVGALTWEAVLPAGAAASVRVRTSSDLVTWSDWSDAVVTSGDVPAVADGRWAQMRVELERGDDGSTPWLEDLALTATGDTWTAAEAVSDGVPSPGQAGAAQEMVVTGLPAGEDVWFAVRVEDEGGLHGPVGTPVQGQADPPSVALAPLVAGPTVPLTITASSDVGVETVEVLLNGAVVATLDTPERSGDWWHHRWTERRTVDLEAGASALSNTYTVDVPLPDGASAEADRVVVDVAAGPLDRIATPTGLRYRLPHALPADATTSAHLYQAADHAPGPGPSEPAHVYRFYDGFDRAELGADWETPDGPWSLGTMDGRQALLREYTEVASPDGLLAHMLRLAVALPDHYSVETLGRYESGYGTFRWGVATFATDAAHFDAAVLRTNNRLYAQYALGEEIVLGSYVTRSVPADTWLEVGVDVRGEAWDLRVAGTAHRTHDWAHQDGGTVGPWSGPGTTTNSPVGFDHFLIRELAMIEPTVQLGPVEPLPPAELAADTVWRWAWDTSGLAAGEHTITVRARDRFGAGGEASETLTVGGDSHSPPAILAPADGALVDGDSVDVLLEGPAGATVELLDAGATVATAVLSASPATGIEGEAASHEREAVVDSPAGTGVTLPAFDPAGATNVALGRPVEASTQYSSLYPGVAVTDGQLEDGTSNAFYWLAPSQTAGGTLTVDLEQAHVISSVRLYNSTNRHWQDRSTADFRLEVSDDGETWAPVHAGTLVDDATHAAEVVTFASPLVARYVRFIADTWHGSGAGLGELEVMGSAAPLRGTVETQWIALPGATHLASLKVDEAVGGGDITHEVSVQPGVWKAPTELAGAPLTDGALRLRATLARSSLTDAAPVLDRWSVQVTGGVGGGSVGTVHLAEVPLDAGLHTLTASIGGAVSSPISVDMDPAPPGAVVDLAATPGPVEGDIVLTWTAPGDDGPEGTASAYTLRRSLVAPTGWTFDYGVDVGGPLPAAAGTPQTWTVSGLDPGVTWFFGLTAADDHGQVSGLSNTPSTTAGDTTVPTVAITSPAQGEHLSGIRTVTVDADDPSGVARVDVLVDGDVVGFATEAPYAVEVDTTAFADGDHILTAVAFDPFDNSAQHALEVVLDNTPPVVTIAAVPSPTHGPVTLVVTASDNLTPTEEIVLRDQLGGVPPFDIDAEGEHTVTITATDKAGVTSSDDIVFTVDETGPPAITDLAAAPGVSLTWTAPSDAAAYEVRYTTDPPRPFGDGSDGPLEVTDDDDTLDEVWTAIHVDVAAGEAVLPVDTIVGFGEGDEVLLYVAQGADAGRHQFATLAAVTPGELAVEAPLTIALPGASQVVFALRVPHFTDVTVFDGGRLTARPWDGTSGGVLAFRASGAVVVQPGGSIDATGRGYRGFAVEQAIECKKSTDGRTGEGQLGISDADRPNGYGVGGGGSIRDGVCDDGGGGGGGGHLTAGSDGEDEQCSQGGRGGHAIGDTGLARLLFGGGGGEAGADEDGGGPGYGGHGGGVIYVAAAALTVAGTLASDGHDGGDGCKSCAACGGYGCGMGGGGGGAGGSVRVVTDALDDALGDLRAAGGDGGLRGHTCGGHGGDGSAGRLLIEGGAAFFDWASATPLTAGVPDPPAAAGVGELMEAGALAEGATAFFAARSRDPIGNLSPLSNIATLDNSPPDVSLDAPGDGSTLTRPVRVEVTASDDVEVARVELELDGAPLTTLTSAPWSWAWDVRSAPPGPHTLTARAVDSSDLEATAEIGVTVSPQPPDAPTITAPAAGSVVTRDTVSVAGVADAWSDVQIRVDGELVDTVSAVEASTVRFEAEAVGVETAGLLPTPDGTGLEVAPPGGSGANVALTSAGSVVVGGLETECVGDAKFQSWCTWRVTATCTEALTYLGRVTLAQPTLIDLIRFRLYDLDSREYFNYRVDVSEDGGTFHTWVDRTGSGEDYVGWQELPGDAQRVQYIDVYISGSTSSCSGHILELEAYEATDGRAGFAIAPQHVDTSAAFVGAGELLAQAGAGSLSGDFLAVRDRVSEGFDDPTLSGDDWIALGAAVVDGELELAGTGTWGDHYAAHRTPITASSDTVATARLYAPTTSSHRAMFGFKTVSDDQSYTEMPYALYFDRGTLRVYESGGNEGSFGSIAAGVWHDLRITLRDGGLGALYEVRAEGEAEWTVVHESEHVFRGPMLAGFSIREGVFRFDDLAVRAPAWSPLAELSDPDVDPSAVRLRAWLRRDQPADTSPVLDALELRATAGAPGPGEGLFRSALTLAEGPHEVEATAVDPLGPSLPSPAIPFTVDSGPAEAVADLAAEAQTGGLVLLTWGAPPDEPVASYAVYRSDAVFSDVLALSPIATVSQPGFVDTTGASGTFWYAVTSTDAVGNVSLLSNVVDVDADESGPTASVATNPPPPLGVGEVEVVFMLSEDVAPDATFAWTPPGALEPLTIAAAQTGTDPPTWTGLIEITPDLPDGQAEFSWAGLDATGNLGTGVAVGRFADVDTTAPTGTVSVTPAAPLGAGHVSVVLKVSEVLAAPPLLTLTPEGGAPVSVAVTGGPITWLGAFVVDPAFGDGTAVFALQASDAAGNPSGGLTAGAQVLVDTDPPGAPFGLTAEQQPGGWFLLTWSAPPGEPTEGLTYRLRRSPAGGDAVISQEIAGSSGTQPSAQESPPLEGTWTYTVSAVDVAGNEGPESAPVQVEADPPAPADPETVVLTAVSYNSLGIAWTASADAGGTLAGYEIRVDGQPVATLAPDVLSTTIGALDPASAYTIRVATFDASGKQSIGAALTGHTLVANPTGAQAVPGDERVTLSWSPSDPAVLKHYALYQEASAFGSVEALVPAAIIAPDAASALLTGLANGTPVHLAVVAVNQSDAFDTTVTSSVATPADDVLPGAPQALELAAIGHDSLTLTWTPHPADDDIDGYQLQLDGEVVAIVAGTSHTFDGLAPASAFSLGVAAVDEADNVGPAATLLAHTLVPHPTDVALEPHDKSLTVTWTAPPVAPAHIGEYGLYVLPATFLSVASMSPSATAPAGTTSATLDGLANGQTWYVAVTTVNASGGEIAEVTPVPGVPFDDGPPPPPTALEVIASGPDEVTVAFTPSADPDGDLDAYRVTVDGLQVDELPHGASEVVVAGLTPASKVTVGISSVDAGGNESAPALIDVYTWVDNPAVTITEIGHERLTVGWAPAEPADHVASYAVYVDDAPFTDVSAMTPTQELPADATEATILDLSNGFEFWVAVTAVTKSGGEAPAVTPDSALPAADTVGPTVVAVTFDGAPLLAGGTVAGDGPLGAEVDDATGVAWVRFIVDGLSLGVDQSGADGWSVAYAVGDTPEGEHTLEIVCGDVVGNTSTYEQTFQLAIAPPEAPVVTAPADDTATNAAQVLVAGTAPAGTTVTVYLGGAPWPSQPVADAGGGWAVLVTLAEGVNPLQASATNTGGESQLSDAVSVLYDASEPSAPKSLKATSAEGGVVHLDWFDTGDAGASGLAGYRVYRSALAFVTPGDATPLGAGLQTALERTDVPPADGVWYYGVTAWNHAGTEGPLSTVVAATADSTGPSASVVWTPNGAVAPDGRVGPGEVEVDVTFSEALLAEPFFSVAPASGLARPVDLVKVDEFGWRGTLEIDDSMGSGDALAVMSARDPLGNRGTLVTEGGSLLLDTRAPSVTSLTVTPGAPIANDLGGPAALTVTVELDEPLDAGSVPALGWALSQSAPEAIPLPLTQLSETTWSGPLTLPASAGDPAEELVFTWVAEDDLGNVSTAIAQPASFEVYQGDLPALSAPLGLSAVAAPGGGVALSFSPVTGAAEYQIYRQGPGDAQMVPGPRVAATAHEEVPGPDGLWHYAVASVRIDGGEESLSEPSPAVSVTTDSVAPPAPVGLTAELAGNGIVLEWSEAPGLAEPVTWALYRSAGQEITELAGLEPLTEGLTQLLVVDPTPSTTDHAYAVAAVDAAGNRSPPSGTAYLNAELLPVGSLEVRHMLGEAPVLSWSHAASDLQGFVVAVDGADVSGLVAGTTWTDDTWSEAEQAALVTAAGARTYEVRAVDDAGAESLPRMLLLPAIELAVVDATELARDVLQAVALDVTPPDAVVVSRSEVLIADATWHVAFGTEVVVGGDAAWPDPVQATVAVETTPNPGELVRVEASVDLAVRTDTYPVEILDAPFTAGAATGDVQLVLHNPHGVSVELVTAEDTGKAASTDVRFVLTDDDDNVLSTASLFQALGDGVVTTPGGRTVARVEPGASWTSQPVALPLPPDAPDSLRVRLEIDALHHRLGHADHALVHGPNTSRAVSLVDAAYDAEVLAATPESGTGEGGVELSGRAFDPATGTSLPEVPVKVVVSVDGFDRERVVVTDGVGEFLTVFEPLPTEGGIYQVWANHPDVDTRLPEASFTIERVFVTPASAEPIIAANYPYVVTFEVSTAEGTGVTGLRLEPGLLPTGVTLEVPAAVDLAPATTAALEVVVTATNEAPEANALVLDLVSDGPDGPLPWGPVQITYLKTEAAPSLAYTPSLLVTGVARGDASSESLTLTNKGLSRFREVELSLVNATKTGPAAPWVFVSTGASLGDIDVGEERAVTVTFAPPDTVTPTLLEPYSFFLRVTSQGDTVEDIPVYASVDDSGEGGHLFKVSDIYTGTLREDGSVIGGLEGAKVKLDKAFGTPQSVSLTTDALGEALFEGLTVGTWKARVSAPGHEAVEVALAIKPGLVGASEVLLPTPVITFEWEVTETTVEDEYTVVLQAVFETDVPAPVVIAEPVGIELPEMAVGDVLYGETTLTNHGLVRADDLSHEPPSVPGHKFELLVEPPTALQAKEQVTLPWRVTRLEDDDPDGDASGAGKGCGAYHLRYCYLFKCANGVLSGGCAGQWITRSGSGSGSGCGIDWPGGGGGGGGWLGPIGGFAGGPGCDPCQDPGASEEAKACCGEGASQDTGSSVQLITGGYVDDADDLLVGVRGFDLVIGRDYSSSGGWQLTGVADDLSLDLDAEGSGNIIYRATSFDQVDEAGLLFESNDERIARTADGGFRYLIPRGGHRDFDADGLLVSATSLHGATVAVVRTPEGRLGGWLDDAGEQVLTLEWDGPRVAAAESWDGRRVEYAWDGGELLEVSGPEGLTVYEYDSKGRLVHKIAPNGTERHIEWSDSGVVASVLDGEGVGAWFSYGYNSGTKQYYSASVFTDGTLHERWYDDAGELAAESFDGTERLELELAGSSIAGEDGYLSASIDRVGLPTDSWAWTSRGQLAEHTDERGVTTRLEYDADGVLVRRIEAAGAADARVTDYEYGEDGELDRRIQRGAGDDPDLVFEFEHDTRGNWSAVTGPGGSQTQRTVSPARHVVSLSRPDGALHEFVRDERGWPLIERLTPPDGGPAIVLAQYSYSVRPEGGDRVVYTDAGGDTYVVDLDVEGRVVRAEDQAGRTTSHEYDAAGRLVASVSWDGEETTHTWEALAFGIERETRAVDGEVAEITDRDAYGRVVRQERGGQETVTIYDGARPEPTEVVYPDGSRQVLTHDDRARRTKTKWQLPSGEVLQETYGWDGPLLASVTRPSGGYWAREYDSHGALTAFTNAAGHTVGFARDHHGHLVSLTDGAGIGDGAVTVAGTEVVGFARDGRGRADSRTFEDGETLSYTWHPMGWLTRIESSEGAVQDLEWDLQGRLLARHYFEPGEAEPSVSHTGTWDATGRPLVVSSEAATRTTEWDDFARTETVSVDFGPFTKTYTVTHDARHRITGYTSPEGAKVSYEYDAAGRLSAVSVPDEGDITWSWPAPGLTIRTLPGGGTIEVTRDPLGRTHRIETPAATWDVTWDALRPSSMSGPAGTHTWTYDAAGRVIQGSAPSLPSFATTYDARGRRAGAVAQLNARGRQVTRQHEGLTQTLVYDAANQLVELQTDTGEILVSYAYDGTGRRVSKKVGEATTYFLYGHFGLMAEYDGDGSLLRSYGWRPELEDAHRKPLWVRTGGATWYYVVDFRNAPLRLVDGTGATTGWSAETEAFGRAHVAASSTVLQPLRLPGQYADEESGLHYNVYRYYDPTTGLFITRDPLAEQGGDTYLVRYAFADPLRADDPSGLGGGYHAKGGSDGFDMGASMSAGGYWGVGGELGAGSGLETEDCCGKKNGQICYYVKASAEGGVGWGAKAGGVGATAKLGSLGAKGKCRVCSGCRGKAPNADCSLTAGAYGPSIEGNIGPWKGGIDSGGYEEKYSTSGDHSKGRKPPGWELGGKHSVW